MSDSEPSTRQRHALDDGDRENGLRVEHVTHAFDTHPVLEDVSLHVPPGRVCCLVGPSGSGKSTLLRLIAGLEPLRRGSIQVDGQLLAEGARAIDVPPERRPVGLVFQDYALFPHLDAAHNVAFGLEGSRRSRLERAHQLLDSVDLTAKYRAMPHTLSGGEQQRVALARALARNPGVMLLDEPFSGLDARLREEIRAFTLERLRSAGVATLIVTHDPSEALLAGDLVAVIFAGRIEQQGAADEVYRRSRSLRVAEAFGSVNRIVCELDAPKQEVRCALGRLSLDADRLEHLTTGSACELLLRPESLLVWTKGAAGATQPYEGENVWRFSAEIERVNISGASVDLHLRGPAETSLRALGHHGSRYEVGGEAMVHVHTRDAIVVPRARA